jgi:hypothetical protein
VIALSLALAAALASAETQIEIASLAGLPGVEVVIEKIPTSIRKTGLEAERIKADIEQRLRSRGVPVVPESSALDGNPSLHLRVRALSAEGGLVYSAALMLFQGVALAESPAKPALAITWEAEAMGFSARSSRYDVENALLSLTNAFAKDFFAANPGE